MPLRSGEAFILRTYALKESDKIVSFFTRDFGKCRGVARGARRPKSRFGSTLEPLSHVRAQFFEREGKELCNLDSCELLESMLRMGGESSATSLLHSVAVACMVEIGEKLLPEREINDAAYRLLLAVLPPLRRPTAEDGEIWLPFTYYLFWMVRLGGFLPTAAGEAQRLASRFASQPLGGLDASDQQAAAGPAGQQLRQFLMQRIEEHLEGRLQSRPLLAGLESAAAPG